MNTLAQLKQQAGYHAAEMVQSNMVVGLGTGSTTQFALERLAQMLKSGQVSNIVGIPSSVRTEKIATELGIPLTTLTTHPEIDINIDGADEVDPQLNLIKGGGGALLREKIIAQAAKRNIIIVDEGKLSPMLGVKWVVPIEVIPFAHMPEGIFLKSLGAIVSLRKTEADEIYQTDQKNYIIDAKFGPIQNISAIANAINQRAGIVEHGMFINIATEVIVAATDGIRLLNRTS